MAITVARYTFSSWLRKGIGNRITEVDHLGGGASATKERSNVPIDVVLNSAAVHKEFALLGPGDIIGINPHVVVRTEPLRWITNFEPNYLAFVEFYDEDFLWRYTPAKANGDRLRPWLALLVLEVTEDGSEFTYNKDRLPLPTVTVKKKEALPPPNESWAWGHVHINQGHDSPTEFEEFLLSLHDLHHANADNVISRLVSPRKLEPDRAYRAFVVPAFETGRLAGLEQDTSNVEAQLASWNASSAGVELPVYFEWYFRTGQNEDFESLVKLLEPRPMDKRVGIRDMDGSAPGFGMNAGTDIGQILPATEPQTVIGLEGALKSPSTKSKPEQIDTSRSFFGELESILNFPAELQAASNTAIDPVVSPPIYGENHAIDHTVDVTAGGWLNQLNRDPRNRVPAGFGTNIVQKHQEDYVARAWEQVKKILEANRRIVFSVFSMSAAQAITTNFVAVLKPAELLSIFAPVTKKVKGSATTLRHQLENSTLPPAAIDTAMRRLIRPRGAFGKKLRAADPGFTHGTLIEELNDGTVSAAPPKQVPDSLITDEDGARGMPQVPAWLSFLLKNRLLILILILLLLFFFGLITFAWPLVFVLAAVAIVLYFLGGRLLRRQRQAEALTDPAAVLEDVKSAPPRPDFHFTTLDPVVPVAASGSTQVSTAVGATSSNPGAVQFSDVTMFTPRGAGQDSLEAENFRRAATALNTRLVVQPPERVITRFDLANAHAKLSAALQPTVAFPKRLAADVRFAFDPTWLAVPEHLVPAMAYPDFPDPMYEKLRDISSELFLPNLKLIPPNTISLLVTNPEFIESYMTGLNHEFGRELLWREYPTDTRGSYFRQFWDVKGIIADDPALSPEELAEVYKDIEPLDTWPSSSGLGEHRNKKRPQGKQLVLVIRGELLKKYPNTIVYAQKAHMGKTAQDPPVIVEVKTEAQMKDEIEFPLFRAEIQPDIRFFGVDMTVEQARGDANPQNAGDDWGWYFVIQQIPGEPRFGMDIEFDPDDDPSTPITWDDLSWAKLPEGTRFITLAQQPVASFFTKLSAAQQQQWGRNSADMAFILFQKPVMIAVHAKEMLEDLSS
ncbi:MAG TPA: hypothetical protein VHK90_17890 [Thermoanaerobaculia bacterium]|nr:hypothetical protein [Thermoanaerobaculia bacterium]